VKGDAEGMQADAAAWVARMDAGDWTDALEAELQRWLARDPQHRGALLHAQAAWATTDPANIVAPPEPVEARPMFGRRRMIGCGAAAIAASAGGYMLLADRRTILSTGVGEVRRVPLDDGSTAAINTASEIEIVLTADRRRVRIDRGEAWFQVAKDRARPFLVEAGRARIQAVGTAFSVRRRDGGAEVLVTEGVVEAWVAGAEARRIRLSAGSRAFVADDAAIREQPAVPAAIDHALAWRSGNIDLAGDRLDHAVAEFNRHNRRMLVIADPRLEAEQFDGVFRADDPEGFARSVAGTLGAPIDLSDPARIVIGK